MSEPRIAGAPISWGISEVAGWGIQLPVARVLEEMREVGYSATELGPDGFLPAAPADKAATLSAHGLTAVGSFVPLVMHQPDADPLPRVRRELQDYAATGAEVLVVAAVTGLEGYDGTRSPLTEHEWSSLLDNLGRVRAAAADAGATVALHPHAGTVVETRADVETVLARSRIPFCFDTGHLLIGGTDPVKFAAEHVDRIAHVHLKDVALAGMRRVKDGLTSYYDAITADELYRPLGRGDIDVRAIVTSLLAGGYRGWFVLEQDKVVRTAPDPGAGPVEDARASVTYLRSVIADLAPGTT